MPAESSTDGAAALLAALDAQANCNSAWFARHPEAPCCSCCAGCRYQLIPKTEKQTFHGADEILKDPSHGWTCADLVAYDVGSLRAQGIPAEPVILESAPYDYHAIYEVDGVPVDPSAKIVSGRCICEAGGD